MNRGEPAHPHRLRNGTCVTAVSLDGHDRGRALHTPGLDADRRQVGGLQTLAEPGRQRSGFQAKTFDRNLGCLQPSYNRLRFSIRFAFSKDDAGIIDNADGSLVERYIKTHEVRHGSLRVIDGYAAPILGGASRRPQSPHLYVLLSAAENATVFLCKMSW